VAALPASATSASHVVIPKLNRDPIQSLCPFSVIVDVCGRDMEIPPLPAADWLAVLMVENLDLDNIFPGFLSPEDEDLVDDLLTTGQLDMDEYEDILLSVIETASARDWWVTFRLVEMARTSWDVLGAELTLRGVDATQVSLAAWLDVVLILALQAMDPQKTQMFTMKLQAPPPEVEADEPEMAVSDFMAMAG
jgi:hypothetical protein